MNKDDFLAGYEYKVFSGIKYKVTPVYPYHNKGEEIHYIYERVEEPEDLTGGINGKV